MNARAWHRRFRRTEFDITWYSFGDGLPSASLRARLSFKSVTILRIVARPLYSVPVTS